MNGISSVSDTSYAYLATLSRLDTNGDGVLSRGELAADDKPGILTQLNDGEDGQDASPKLSDGVLAFMMRARESGGVNFLSQDTSEDTGDLYKNTYGQYDLDIAS